MAALTKAQAEAQLTAYLAAETKVLGGQSYRIGDRQLTRADLSEIREGIKFWRGEVNRMTGSRRRMRFAVT